MKNRCINLSAAPRLAESEADFLIKLKEEADKNGFLILETPKARFNYKFDLLKGLYVYEKTERVSCQQMYWGYMPIWMEPTETEIQSLHNSISNDTVSVYAKVGGSEIRIHRPIGVAWRKTEDVLKES